MTETNRHREPVRYELVAETDEVTSAESVFTAAHRHLRGRYHVAGVAAVVFAAAFAVGAWHGTKPQYESTGLVRIDPVPATTMHDPDGLPLPSLMAAYVAEQAMILRGRTVLESAAADPLLRAAGWPSGDHGIAALEQTLEVADPRGQNIISLSVLDTDPNRAREAVDAVLRSYEAEAGGPAERERRLRLQSLEQRRSDLELRIAQYETDLIEASQGTSPELIERMHINKVEELIALDAQIQDLRTRLAAIESGDPSAASAASAATASTPGDSGLLATLNQQQNEILARIDAMSVRYGARHPMIRDLEAELETVRIRIAALTGTLPESTPLVPDTAVAGGIDVGFSDMAEAVGAGGISAIGGLTPADRFQSLLQSTTQRRDTLRGEISELSRRRVAINTLRERSNDAQMRLSEIDRRIDVIQASAQTDSTGVTIATWGDLPVTPKRDRRAQLAVAGGFAGASFGVLLVLGLSAVAPRIRFSDDLPLVKGAPPIAAILPDMSEGGAAADIRSTRGIHQLRSIVELDTVQPDRNVVVVTGCARGEGRTSIALALATGLARSGRRTLVVDADLTNSKLSRELLLDNEPGLVEALGVNPSDARVHETSETGLWALPVGLRGVIGEEVLSRPRLQWLLDTLRSRFDAIVVDTGPMLASAEGPTLAGVADRTVLVIERGVRAATVSTALDRLRQVSARCIGVVLNRAEESDFRDLEVRSETYVPRRGTIVETRPSAFAPAGRSSAVAATTARPFRNSRNAETATTPDRTAA